MSDSDDRLSDLDEPVQPVKTKRQLSEKQLDNLKKAREKAKIKLKEK